MRDWFAAAGLGLDRIERLEGGELTVILWRAVRPGVASEQQVAA
jgi:ArsR family transcriptional regulator